MARRYNYAGPILSIRWIRVTVTVALFLQIFLSYLLAAFLPGDKDKRLQRIHPRNADRLYRAFVLLKGVYIKAGQFLSTQVVLLPPAYLKAMAQMQDRVPKAHNEAVRARLNQAFGDDLTETFRHFDMEPLATASIGQVHKAQLQNGDDVVVKVRYPGIRRFFMSDLKVIEKLVPVFWATMEWAFEGSRSGINHQEIVGELVHYLRQELDYEQERRNHERMIDVMGDIGRDDVLVPRIYGDLCTSTLLVMEYVDGENLGTWFLNTDADQAVKDQVYEALFATSVHGILRHGFFQADPHPGNFMVTPDRKLVLLDFGCTQQMPEAFHHGIIDLIGGFMNNDTATAAQALWNLGFRTHAETVDSLEEWVKYGFEIIRVVIDHFQKGDSFVKHLQENVERYSRDVIQLADKHRLKAVPKAYVMLGRAIATPPVPFNRFQPRIDLMKIVMPYVFELSTANRQASTPPAETPAPNPPAG